MICNGGYTQLRFETPYDVYCITKYTPETYVTLLGHDISNGQFITLDISICRMLWKHHLLNGWHEYDLRNIISK